MNGYKWVFGEIKGNRISKKIFEKFFLYDNIKNNVISIVLVFL